MIRLAIGGIIAALLTATIFGYAASLDLNAKRLTIVSNTRAATGLTTQLSGGTQGPAASITVAAGTAVTDQATLSGATGTAGGTVTYTVYTDSGCTSVHAEAGTKNVVNGSVPSSDSVTFTASGSYYWRATYTGDGNNQPYTSVCGDEVLTVTAAQPAKLAFTQQPSGSFTAGSSFVPQPKVTILDTYSNVVTVNNTTVIHLEITANTGTAGATLTCNPNSNDKTASSGVATFADCSINRVGTGYTLTATSPLLAQAVSSPIDITVGSAAKLAYGQQPTNTAAGSAISPAVTVRIEDNYGNVVTTATNSVSLAIGTNAGSGTLTGGGAVNAVNGIATFGALSINKTGIGYTLSASSGLFTSIVSSTFNITAGQPSKLVFTQQPSSSSTAGTSFASQPKVTIFDANDNVVTANNTAIVHLEITTNTGTAGAVLTCNPTSDNQTASSGVATFAGCSIDKAGTGYTLTASSPSLASALTGTFNISAGAASKLVFGQQPTTTTAGATMSPAVTVRIEDSLGNLVTTATNSVGLAISSNPAGGVLTGGAAVNAVGGIATFSGLAINTAGNGYTLLASSSSLTNVTSSTFNITGVAPPPLSSCADANVYLMLDRTGGNASYLPAERAGAIGLVNKFQALVNQPKIAIGAVGGTNGTAAATEKTLTASYGDNDGAQDGDVYGAIEKAMANTSSVGSNLKAAIDVAAAHLATATSGPKIVVFFSDGDPSEPESTAAANQEAAYDASDAAKLANVKIVSVHFGSDPSGFAGKELMAAIATGLVAPPSSHAGHGHEPGALSDASGENSDGDNFFIALDAVGMEAAYEAICDPGAMDPTPNIQVTATGGAIGTVLNAQAALSGGTTPTGTITFRLYPPTDGTCTGSASYTQAVNVASGNSTYSTTPGYTATALGVWNWTTAYSGDSNNTAATTACGAAPVTVTKATPTLSTSATASISFGQTIKDTATLGGGYNLTGTLSFSVYGDASCTTTLSPAPSGATVNGAGSYPSGTFTPSVAGTYRWRAFYSGDSNNNAVSGACNDPGEASVVTSATHDLFLSMSPSYSLVGSAAAGSVDIAPNGGSQIWLGTATVTGSSGWALSLRQTGPGNFEGARLKADVWLSALSGSCSALPGTNATNYVAGNPGVDIPDATLPRTVAISLTGNASFVLPGGARTICLMISNTDANNGASHHFVLAADAASYLRGPF